jgi:hypothetical protein
MRARFLRVLTASGVVALASVGLVSAFSGTPAAPQEVSDGNVTTCAQVGAGGTTQVAGSGDNNVGITTGESSITVTIKGAGVVLDAVVVKGGPNANIYRNVESGTYFTPDNGSGGPAGLSHYFVCYHIEEVTTTVAPTTAAPTTAAPTTAAPTTAGTQTVRPQVSPQVSPQGAARPAAPAPAGVQVQPRVTG